MKRFGIVYVMWNSEIPKYHKIGRCNIGNLTKRQIAFSKAAFVPSSFIIKCAWVVYDVVLAEKLIHMSLRRYRSGKKELFNIPKNIVVSSHIEGIFDDFEIGYIRIGRKDDILFSPSKKTKAQFVRTIYRKKSNRDMLYRVYDIDIFDEYDLHEQLLQYYGGNYDHGMPYDYYDLLVNHKRFGLCISVNELRSHFFNSL